MTFTAIMKKNIYRKQGPVISTMQIQQCYANFLLIYSTLCIHVHVEKKNPTPIHEGNKSAPRRSVLRLLRGSDTRKSQDQFKACLAGKVLENTKTSFTTTADNLKHSLANFHCQ